MVGGVSGSVSEKSLTSDICKLMWESSTGTSDSIRIIYDNDTYKLILCVNKSKSVVGKFSTLDVAIKEAGVIMKKGGLQLPDQLTIH